MTIGLQLIGLRSSKIVATPATGGGGLVRSCDRVCGVVGLVGAACGVERLHAIEKMQHASEQQPERSPEVEDPGCAASPARRNKAVMTGDRTRGR